MALASQAPRAVLDAMHDEDADSVSSDEGVGYSQIDLRDAGEQWKRHAQTTSRPPTGNGAASSHASPPPRAPQSALFHAMTGSFALSSPVLDPARAPDSFVNPMHSASAVASSSPARRPLPPGAPPTGAIRLTVPIDSSLTGPRGVPLPIPRAGSRPMLAHAPSNRGLSPFLQLHQASASSRMMMAARASRIELIERQRMVDRSRLPHDAPAVVVNPVAPPVPPPSAIAPVTSNITSPVKPRGEVLQTIVVTNPAVDHAEDEGTEHAGQLPSPLRIDPGSSHEEEEGRAAADASPHVHMEGHLPPVTGGGLPPSPAVRASKGGAMGTSLNAVVPKQHRKSLRPKHLLKKTIFKGDSEWEAKQQRKKAERQINERHRLYHLSYGMMLGMWVSINRVVSSDKLHIDDFNSVSKLLFTKEGTTETPPLELRHSFKFKDYTPKVFHHLRERFGVNADEYKRSLGGYYDFIEFQSNSKSGQFFFFSHDGRFMIKTQTRAESMFLRRIIPHYFKYVVENPDTFLPRFYGLHRIKMAHLGKITHFTVMHSVFDSSAYDDCMTAIFDLKGSWVGRAATAEEKARPPGKFVFKDNDLVEQRRKFRLGSERAAKMLAQLRKDADWLKQMQIMDYSLLVGIRPRVTPRVGGMSAGLPGSAEAGHHASDSSVRTRRGRRPSRMPRAHVVSGENIRPTFARSGLSAFNLHELAEEEEEGMSDADRSESRRPSAAVAESSSAEGPAEDDSKLWLEDVEPPPDEFSLSDWEGTPKTCKAVPSIDEHGAIGDEVYYFGIIDILQQYNIRKNLETIGRSLLVGRKGISCVPPREYADRFVQFLGNHIE
jgi:1-phosphatidylinositol-4-phosphate 5-kinase